MCFYYYACAVGILQLRTLITIEKMALPDSYLQTFQTSFEASIKNMQPISVFILNPGDLRDPKRLKSMFFKRYTRNSAFEIAAIKQIVHDFENATYSYGSESTFFWIPLYEEFLNFYGETDEFTYAEMPTFFKSATYFYLTTFVKYNESACLANNPQCITSFFFMTNFHGVRTT
uniref:Peptidase_M13 domain-containing protein n=1 Tax=Haemonchus placei TaxID=6290 RepID=A0A0N4W6L8_HAEPC